MPLPSMHPLMVELPPVCPGNGNGEEFAVMVIADPGKLELQMNVNQRNLSRIVPGLKAKYSLEKITGYQQR